MWILALYHKINIVAGVTKRLSMDFDLQLKGDCLIFKIISSFNLIEYKLN